MKLQNVLCTFPDIPFISSESQMKGLDLIKQMKEMVLRAVLIQTLLYL